ncbi:MAG: HD domain-containing protein [Victivallaceae bacterium]
MSEYSDKLTALEKDFIEYADRFLIGEPSFDRNIILKREHSLRVRLESAEIVNSLDISEHDRFLAEVAGLFHDVGRFEQYTRYRTFVDLKSEDHGQRGMTVLKQQNFLKDFSTADVELIITAISCHNRRALPDGLNERELLTTRTVRDADKLDIMNVVLDYYRHPETNEAVTLELKDSPEISDIIKQCLVRRECASMRDLQTVTDFKIAQLGWVYDLNFRRTFQLYLERGYHYELLKHLPETSEISELFQAVDRYVLTMATV